MHYVDLVFPLNLGPLTYRVPGTLNDAVRPGMMVNAEIKKSIKKGIVIGPSPETPRGRIKEIDSIIGENPALSPRMLTLIQWMAGYYFAKEGTVLKSILPREFYDRVKPRGKQESLSEVKNPFTPLSFDDNALQALASIRDTVKQNIYKTFLLQAPSTRYELGFMLEAIKGVRNVIILVPDHGWITHIAEAVGEAVGRERLALYHAGLSRGRRSEALERIGSGRADVVLGSRGAAFAPLKEVSLIAVLQEETTAYKEEGGIRYNARDMAVMRGYQEKAAVLLSSICPSVESFYNAGAGKYTLIEPPSPHLRAKVRVVDMRKTESAVSRILRKAAETRVAKGEKVMLYINRKGFSMLECGDCGHLEACPQCDIPMVFYKGKRTIRCGYCGNESPPPDVCPTCRSHELRPVGKGMERVEEEIRELDPIGVDRKRRGLLQVISETEGGLAVGTKVMTRSAGLSGVFSLAGVINADAHLYLPDFRSVERAYQDLMYTADRVKPGGQIIIQTRNPHSAIFSHLRNYSSRRFYWDELAQRETLGYPPYSKMALITVAGNRTPELGASVKGSVEVLGPVSSLTKGGKKVHKIMLKAPTRAELKSAVEALLARLKDFRVAVDVDPAAI